MSACGPRTTGIEYHAAHSPPATAAPLAFARAVMAPCGATAGASATPRPVLAAVRIALADSRSQSHRPTAGATPVGESSLAIPTLASRHTGLAQRWARRACWRGSLHRFETTEDH